MFGSSNQNDDQQLPVTTDEPAVNPAMRPGDQPYTSVAAQSTGAPVAEPTSPPVVNDEAPVPDVSGNVTSDSNSDVDVTAAEPTTAADNVQADENDKSSSDRSNNAPPTELMDLKQKVLQQLSPLVDHLDQTPQERFKIIMMMIQASDDHSLIKSAYEAAQQIPDEKAKAQALLDVVNEINYFTQQKS